ncbi:ATP-binding protein [Polaribacter sp. Q13]|uniref:sensor histidine kinase n=1 Tax=Polaribacter sp. Q13 TaxID=2806551 RepID=UPI00193BD211|nr:ATP-binding protein [Polaribacter sp. Q13]QVY66390.1 PAS domain S-box protein [Polaribacter sp. Q13]
MKFINIKKLFLFLIPLSLISYLIIHNYYRIITENQLEIIKNGAVNDLNSKGIIINDMYRSLATDIDLIHWEFSKDFAGDNQPKKEKLKEFFLHLSNLQTTYDQVRFIDTLGLETIRVDFDSINAAKVKEYDKLQNKSNRYYFKNAVKVQKGDIYFSNIDLNMEYGKIETPYNPVLRVAKKVYTPNGKWNGLIVINYFMDNLFHKLATQNKGEYADFELRTEEGFSLISKNKRSNFAHITSNSDSFTLYKTEKKLWNEIQQHATGSYTNKNFIYVYKKLTIDDNSIKNNSYKDNKALILIHKIDIEKIKKDKFIYVAYKWISFIIIVLLILFLLIGNQYYNYKLQLQYKKLQHKNNQLENLKNKLQETLRIKLDELKLTERKFYSIFNNAGIGITLLDLKGKPVFTNKKLMDVLGYSEKDLTKMTFSDFTHPDDLENDLDKFNKLINREIDAYNIEKRYIRKDKTVIWGDLYVSLLVNKENEIINVIGAVSDITERKDAQKETKNLKKIINSLNYIAKVLNIDSVENISEINESINLVAHIEKQSKDILNANKAREELLVNLEQKNTDLNNYAHIVSHDLKTPLRSIYTLLNWIEEDSENKLSEESKTYSQLILENLEKMESLITGILKYSSIDNVDMPEYEINTYDLVNDIIKLIIIPDSVEIKVAANLPMIRGNKHRILQVFQNLLQNAIKSIVTKTGKIEIGVKETHLFWEFYIKDNGKGIDEKYFKKIFELFQSIDGSESKSGIGLSIVKKVIQFYKGEIWVESEVDRGTTFYFTLPKASNL